MCFLQYEPKTARRGGAPSFRQGLRKINVRAQRPSSTKKDISQILMDLFHLTKGFLKRKPFVIEPTCKPGSVECDNLSWICRCRQSLRHPKKRGAGNPCQPFLPPDVASDRVYTAVQSPALRWALTPPFHPYLHKQAVIFCCTFPQVALGCRQQLSCPVKPGLSSPILSALPHSQLREIFYHKCLGGSINF